jgi:chorismate mutase
MSYYTEIEQLRNQINKLDAEIIERIAELIRILKKTEKRCEYSSAIMLNNVKKLAQEYCLNDIGIGRIFDTINDLLTNKGLEVS